MDASLGWFRGRRGRSIEAWDRGLCGPRVHARRRPSGQPWNGEALFAGIDTHKDSLAVIDAAGRRPNPEPGFLELVELLEAHHVTRVGIEGSGNFERASAVHLALSRTPDRDVSVVEVRR